MYQYDETMKSYGHPAKSRVTSGETSAYTVQPKEVSALRFMKPNQPNIFQRMADGEKNSPLLQLKSSADFCVQRKEIGVVVEMIAPAKPGFKSDQDLIGQIKTKHEGLEEPLKNKLFYAIGFNAREGTETGFSEAVVKSDIDEAKTPPPSGTSENQDRRDTQDGSHDSAEQTEQNRRKRIGHKIARIVKERKKGNGFPQQSYQKRNQESYGYIPKYLRWGFDTWTWPALHSNDYINYLKYKTGISNRPMRMNYPFRSWRAFAHKVAEGHWGANEWVRESTPEPRELVYKTADSDQAWKPEELRKQIEEVKAKLSEEPSASSSGSGTSVTASANSGKLGPEDLGKPLVLTAPYHWSKGNPKVKPEEQPDYSYETYLNELNKLEIEQRKILYDENPLNIYYPEPTTFFTKKAADIHPEIHCGVLEGAAKIATIVKAICEANGNQMPEATDLKKMFIFLNNAPLTSDPGLRANSLVSLYNEINVETNPSERTNKLKIGMKKIDQSAYEDNYKATVYLWNTTPTS